MALTPAMAGVSSDSRDNATIGGQDPGRNLTRSPSNWWNSLFWLAFLLIPLINIFVLLRQPLEMDSAFCLYVGQQLMAGKRLYVDILDVNPPLVYFLSVIPNWLSLAFGFDVKVVWIIAANSAVLIPCILSIYILDQLKPFIGWSRALAALTLAIICVIPFVHGFGERDHLAFTALLPLICLAATRIGARKVHLSLALFTSIWAGLFLSLKPFFLVPAVCCLLFVFWRIKAQIFRIPETYIVPGLSALHVLLIVWFTPAYFNIAQIASVWYGGYDVQYREMLATLAIPFCGVIISFFYRPSASWSSLIRLTGLAAFGWILSAIIQHKGFLYHLKPAEASFTLLAAIILRDLWSRMASQIRTQIWPLLGGFLVFALVGSYSLWQELSLKLDYSEGSEVLLPILRSTGTARVMFLSTSLTAFPVVNETNVYFGNTYPCLWMLPGLYRAATLQMDHERDLSFHDFASMPLAEQDLFDRTYLDLARKPKLVIVDARKYKQGMGRVRFDLDVYFLRDARIRDLWSHYRELPPVPNFRIYELEKGA